MREAEKALMDRVLLNTSVAASIENRIKLAKLMTNLLAGWARSFPVRRVWHGEAVFIEVGGRRQWPQPREFSATRLGLIDRFDRDVRLAVGKQALAFVCAPEMIFPHTGPVIWMNAWVVPRAQAKFIGRSFQREIGIGRRSWWA